MATTAIHPLPGRPPGNLQEALALHKKGQWAQAQAIYDAILAVEPRDFEALHLSGVIAAQTRNPTLAVEFIGKAIAVNGKSAAARNHRGLALAELGQWQAALADYDEAIAINAGFAEAHFNRGNVLCQLQRPEAALASYDRAIAIKADHAQAYFNRGNVLCELQRWAAALASYDRAIAVKPDHAEAYSNRGVVLSVLRQYAAALASYDRAIAIKPDHAEAHSSRGVVLSTLKQWDAALASCERAIAIRADYAEAHSNRGVVLGELKQWDAALSSCNRAIALKTDYAEAYFNRGNLLRDMNRPEEALADYDKAIALQPGQAEVHSNRGNLLRDLKQLTAALADYDQAIAIKPDYAEAHTNKSTALLLTGDLDDGWLEYEWRSKIPGTASAAERKCPQPPWRGEDSIAGKTILIHCEQGLGDTLQFCRYATLAATMGARVILEVQEPLVNLLSCLGGVAQVVAKGSVLPDFDLHCPLLSMPRAFGTKLDTVPSSKRYLSSDARRVAQWEVRLGERTCPRVGLAWSGNPNHAHDHERSVALSDLTQHLPGGFQYVSLQREVRERDERALLPGGRILNFADDMDFDNTAALIECLDLVVSVDTSLAHLSGALGKRTWILLSFVPDWRWLLDRDDSPWYPSAKLYRQHRRGDWNGAFERMASDLIQTFAAIQEP
jgi:tetratricopeptide (TPR) repeat protein